MDVLEVKAGCFSGGGGSRGKQRGHSEMCRYRNSELGKKLLVAYLGLVLMDLLG